MSMDILAMVPWDTGQETSTAMDLTLGKKKKRKVGVEDDDDDNADDAEGGDEFDLEEDGQKKQTTAERLVLLSSAMEQINDEDNEGEKPRVKGGGKFNPTSATPKLSPSC